MIKYLLKLIVLLGTHRAFVEDDGQNFINEILSDTEEHGWKRCMDTLSLLHQTHTRHTHRQRERQLAHWFGDKVHGRHKDLSSKQLLQQLIHNSAQTEPYTSHDRSHDIT